MAPRGDEAKRYMATAPLTRACGTQKRAADIHQCVPTNAMDSTQGKKPRSQLLRALLTPSDERP